MGASQQGEFWLLHTRSGSLYVVVSFGQGGRASLDQPPRLLQSMAEVAPFGCSWRNSGAVFRTAPFGASSLAQLQVICVIAKAEGC